MEKLQGLNPSLLSAPSRHLGPDTPQPVRRDISASRGKNETELDRTDSTGGVDEIHQLDVRDCASDVED